MKKITALLVVLFLAFGCFGLQANYAGYIEQRDQYLTFHQSYLLAKQAHQNYQTLKTKQELFESLKQVLFWRDEFLGGYLSLLIDEGRSLIPDQIGVLQDYRIWLGQDKQAALATSSLESAVTVAEGLELEYPVMEKGIFVFLTELTIARQNLVLEKIRLLVPEVEAETKHAFDRQEDLFSWRAEIETELQEVERLQLLARQEMADSRSRRIGDAASDWKTVKKLLVQSGGHLNTTLAFLEETIINFEKGILD
ncbi:MAG: hypothetical protein ABID04_04045 [Patescibacteria group bacterium]